MWCVWYFRENRWASRISPKKATPTIIQLTDGTAASKRRRCVPVRCWSVYCCLLLLFTLYQVTSYYLLSFFVFIRARRPSVPRPILVAPPGWYGGPTESAVGAKKKKKAFSLYSAEGDCGHRDRKRRRQKEEKANVVIGLHGRKLWR